MHVLQPAVVGSGEQEEAAAHEDAIDLSNETADVKQVLDDFRGETDVERAVREGNLSL